MCPYRPRWNAALHKGGFETRPYKTGHDPPKARKLRGPSNRMRYKINLIFWPGDRTKCAITIVLFLRGRKIVKSFWGQELAILGFEKIVPFAHILRYYGRSSIDTIAPVDEMWGL
jgi:hypothetical protein